MTVTSVLWECEISASSVPEVLYFIKCSGKQVFQGDNAVSRVRRSRAREVERDQALYLLSGRVVIITFHYTIC